MGSLWAIWENLIMNRFISHKNISMFGYFDFISEQKNILLLCDPNEKSYSNFVNINLFYDSKKAKEMSEIFNFDRIIVKDSHNVDKITLGNIISFGKSLNVKIDFYGIKLDEKGMLFDSSEYLISQCDTISQLF